MCERGWDIKRAHAIREKSLRVRLKQEVFVKNKQRTAETLPHHPEGHIEVEQKHRLR